jgi:hypothetical protein
MLMPSLRGTMVVEDEKSCLQSAQANRHGRPEWPQLTRFVLQHDVNVLSCKYIPDLRLLCRWHSLLICRAKLELIVLCRLLERLILFNIRPDFHPILCCSEPECALRLRKVATLRDIRIMRTLPQGQKRSRQKDRKRTYHITQTKHDPVVVAFVRHSRVPEPQIPNHDISTRTFGLHWWPVRSSRLKGRFRH